NGLEELEGQTGREVREEAQLLASVLAPAALHGRGAYSVRSTLVAEWIRCARARSSMELMHEVEERARGRGGRHAAMTHHVEWPAAGRPGQLDDLEQPRGELGRDRLARQEGQPESMLNATLRRFAAPDAQRRRALADVRQDAGDRLARARALLAQDE